MVGYRMHRDKRMIHARRVLRGCGVTFVLAVALLALVPGMPIRAMPHEDTSPIFVSSAASVSFAASEQGGEDLFSHALVSHMHFDHHQLVRPDNAVVIPALDTSGAYYLTGVNLFASLEPAPLRRPPRA
jgi:hypothetical protein